MVSSTARLDRVFHALAHPARRTIVQRLAAGERNLSALAAPLAMTFPAVSKHVRVLEEARLVRRRISGREHLIRLQPEPLEEVARWTEQFRAHWEANFQALDALLEEMKAEPPSTQKPRRRR
jgi:DNA-binding transcriptional ArsR family regulator